VVDTPLHGLTDADGVVTFTDVPAANFRVAAYDPSAQGADAELTTGSLDAGAHRELTVELGTRAEQPSTTGALAWEDY
jgi:hypothetical protein